MSVRSAIPEASAAGGRGVVRRPGPWSDACDDGATWVGEPAEVRTDGPGALITSRMPADLGAPDGLHDFRAFPDAVPTEMSARI